jgi:hypothetical protein
MIGLLCFVLAALASPAVSLVAEQLFPKHAARLDK